MSELQLDSPLVLPEPSYERPPDEVVNDVKRHLLDRHGHVLRLRRDVYWPGNRAKRPVVTLELANYARPARYWCAHCPRGHDLFIVGAPVRGPERSALLRLHDPRVGMLLSGVPTERHDEVIDAYDRGELMPAMIDTALARRRQQTKRNPRPAAQRRRRGAQRWMLARYAEIGNVEEVQNELAELLRDDRQARFDILGEDTTRAEETLKADWRVIPIEQRLAARRTALARPERERNADRAARRKHKLTP
jgi:hypothetical protein